MTPQPRVEPGAAVGLGHVLTHAAEVGLPMPVTVHLTAPTDGSFSTGSAVSLALDSLTDLAEWSLYLEQPITTEALTEIIDHHTVDGEFLELPLRLWATVTYTPLRLVDAGAQL